MKTYHIKLFFITADVTDIGRLNSKEEGNWRRNKKIS